MTTPPIRWGILATGGIATSFANGLRVLDDAELLAVGSRTAASAATFGERHNVPRRYGSYQDLVDDPDIDIVYVASPHPFHHEHSLLCLRAGKAVLCEKPFTLNTAQAEQVIAEARARDLFLMEAMWTRFLPHIAALRRIIGEGLIGEVRMVKADFCFRTTFDPDHRLFNPALGGGALLDVGVYPIALASMVLGAPSEITGLAQIGATGVDEQAAMVLKYAEGQLAVLTAATRTATPDEALIVGTTGRIKIDDPWWQPSSLTLTRADQADELIEPPTTGNGYNYEAAEAMGCIRAGKRESEVMPLGETLEIMRVLDQLRARWGVRYPDEAQP